ncbi:TetR/AcrR family transcriptional regulator [Arthrobacter cheniae]|uniref:TetR/AcrR family transcriptional regulator n=1 Tax=Arthrobacter cheniae TaxID=1258888 RepID=A0A3A5M4X6_9MICC|nr:TetR/AcrR family transcriptional regulator [Arthrobacter cheniae]RJT78048.1 TetR/AcrR family transcriptional regulator [Arthrobacter cheniae]
MESAKTAGATAGRPRLSGSADGSPRQEIIREATALFVAKGYAETTMSEIARSAGLRQSSVYYWFARKEHILQALLEENRTSLQVAQTLEPAPGPASARLYAVLHADAVQLCASPLDFYEFERVARSQPQNFGPFFEDYGELHRLVTSIIRQGLDSGELRDVDPEAAATAALSLNEGLQRHYRQPLPGLRTYTADDVSTLSADTTLASLLLTPDGLPGVRPEAAALATGPTGGLARVNSPAES